MIPIPFLKFISLIFFCVSVRHTVLLTSINSSTSLAFTLVKPCILIILNLYIPPHSLLLLFTLFFLLCHTSSSPSTPILTTLPFFIIHLPPCLRLSFNSSTNSAFISLSFLVRSVLMLSFLSLTSS